MQHKITLISGAGSGIGLSIAEKFYLENHKLILLVKSKAQKQKLEKKFNKKITKIFFGDLSNYNFIKKISKKINYVDNLINNAATRNGDFLHKVKKKNLDYIMDLNFKSTFFLTQILTKKMIKLNVPLQI